MKVLLISPLIQKCNYVGDYSSHWPQLGLAYIASSLEKGGHKVKILERKILSGPAYPCSLAEFEKLDKLMLAQIEEFKPSIVGISATTPVIIDAFRTAKAIKSKFSDITIIIGGRHPTTEPIYTLEQCPEIDIVCKGEGEQTMLELANGFPLENIKGIIFRTSAKEIVENPNRPLIENLDELPFPAWHLLDQDYYFRSNISVMRGDYLLTATIMSSRGCPYKCAFCQSPELLDIYGKDYIRYHSVNRVVDEISYLMDRFKIRGISFNDDMFSVNRGRVLQICNRIVDLGINKSLKFTVNLRSDRVDEEILIALKRAGCIHIIYGSESGSEETLKRMNKSLNISKNIEAIKLTKKFGLAAESNIIIGSPGETEIDFLATLNFLKRSKPDKIFISKFYPLPGTRFYKQLLDKNIIKKPKNWDEINDLYVENDDFTFAEISPKRFVQLRNRLAREVVAFTNSFYVIKSNFTKNQALAFKQLTKLILYISFLYLPIYMQRLAKDVAGRFNGNARYFFRR